MKEPGGQEALQEGNRLGLKSRPWTVINRCIGSHEPLCKVDVKGVKHSFSRSYCPRGSGKVTKRKVCCCRTKKVLEAEKQSFVDVLEPSVDARDVIVFGNKTETSISVVTEPPPAAAVESS